MKMGGGIRGSKYNFRISATMLFAFGSNFSSIYVFILILQPKNNAHNFIKL